jgi:tRNA-2-methylthio-N6-dimethylallyladenosine synthase
MKSFHIITFGCQMNEHDSERMAGILKGQKYVRTNDATNADVIILNTCSIREKAEQKFYSELGRLRHLKQERPGLTIAVAGCIAQQEGKNILSRAPYVDMIFGPSDVAKVSELSKIASTWTNPLVEIDGDADYHRKQIPTLRTDRLKAWVSIMYGCNNYCTYCIVPYLRGRERSRPPADVVSEISELAEQGYKEVTLLGQNVNSYGKGGHGTADFPELLAMVNDVPGIERIRFVTSHPRDLSQELIFALRDLSKVCESLHLPVQSGADPILTAMNRKYTRADYLDRIKRLRAAVPHIALTSDIIVGFPGETDQDFSLTIQMLREVEYDSVFAFKYSKRPGTAALKLSDHVPDDVKEARLAQVLDLQKDISRKKNAATVGMIFEVLVDGHSKKGGKLTGRTRGNKAVNFYGADSLIGTLVTVRITDAGDSSLNGELCA